MGVTVIAHREDGSKVKDVPLTERDRWNGYNGKRLKVTGNKNGACHCFSHTCTKTSKMR
jgi:hypothetical protein